MLIAHPGPMPTRAASERDRIHLGSRISPLLNKVLAKEEESIHYTCRLTLHVSTHSTRVDSLNGMDSSSPLAARQRVRRHCARMGSANYHSESEEKPGMKITRIGADIAKAVFPRSCGGSSRSNTVAGQAQALGVD